MGVLKFINHNSTLRAVFVRQHFFYIYYLTIPIFVCTLPHIYMSLTGNILYNNSKLTTAYVDIIQKTSFIYDSDMPRRCQQTFF